MFEYWIYDKTSVLLNFTKSEILLGKGGKDCKCDNVLVLLYKFHIYRQRCRDENVNLTILKNEVYNYYKTEKFIYRTNRKQHSFEKKWQKFETLFQDIEN